MFEVLPATSKASVAVNIENWENKNEKSHSKGTDESEEPGICCFKVVEEGLISLNV